MEANQQPHVAIIPSPGMGHLIPLVEFAKLLVSRYPSFSATLIIPSSNRPGPAQTDMLGSLPASISHVFLDPVDPARLPEGVAHEITITLTHSQSLPSVRAELASLTGRARVVALITDLFGTGYFDVAREMNISPYIYFTSNCMCLQFLFNLPKLDKMVSCEYREMDEPLVMPGCVPLHGKDFLDPAQDRKDKVYQVMLDHINKYGLVDGILVNTFSDLEPATIQALQDDPEIPPVYPVGPVIQAGKTEDGSGSDCFKWLDQQPSGSVLLVSFGSGGTLSTKQVNELALGLETSGQRFLWVVRSPNDHSSFGSFFSAQSQSDPFGFLPPGFVNRVKDRGLLVPSWAPQIKILGHESTGGFMTHCGWNSTLESIVNGVPLIAWPLYAEQKMNAVMLNQGLNVALRPKMNGNGVVEAEEIANVVKELMEGDEGRRVRERMKILSDKAEKAKGEDGSSTKMVDEIVDKWMKTKTT